MKLNYYMRGLGIGIVVTALLMGIASSGKKEQMTDEEIRQRAMEMGMVDGNIVLADMSENHEDEEEQKEEGNEKEEVLTSLSGNGSADNKDSAKDTQTGRQGQENDKEAENLKTENGDDSEGEPEEGGEGPEETLGDNQRENGETVNEIIVISINSGDGSRVVANKLLQAGLIEDAAAFDEYLCRNGYDKRLKTGRHDIPVNATDEEIAASITTKGY